MKQIVKILTAYQNAQANTVEAMKAAPPPLWMMRQAGRYLPEYRRVRQEAGSFMKLCFTPDLATEVTLQPIRRFQFDAAIIFSDILTIPHALGQTVSFLEGHGPQLLALSSNDWGLFLEKAKEESIAYTLEPVYQALRQVKAALPPETALIGFAGSPWTVSTYMMEEGKSTDFSKALSWIKNPESPLNDLLSVLAEKTTEHLSAQIHAGADVVQIFDTWAGLVPLEHQERCLIQPLRRILDGVQALHPGIPMIYFAKGACHLYDSLIGDYPFLAFGMDHHAPNASIEALQRHKRVLQGNVSPEALVAGGDDLDAEIDRVFSAFKEYPFIANLGHGILPNTPIEHVEHLVQRIRQTR